MGDRLKNKADFYLCKDLFPLPCLYLGEDLFSVEVWEGRKLTLANTYKAKKLRLIVAHVA